MYREGAHKKMMVPQFGKYREFIRRHEGRKIQDCLSIIDARKHSAPWAA